jgi:hypothetical protein
MRGLVVHDTRHSISDPMDAVLAEVRRRLAAGREGNFIAELGGPDLGYVLYWARVSDETPPGSPPDERYVVDEVRPEGIDGEGAVTWELVPGGRRDVVAWNVAEAVDRTHQLDPDTVVLVREELDHGSPVEFRALFFRSVAPSGGSRVGRVTGYDSLEATYTVQPVSWNGSAWTDDGAAISDVPNLGEVRAEEEGYLAGPAGSDIYVTLHEEGGDTFLIVHPPRMV